MMRSVLIALIPGTALYALCYGWGVLIQILLAIGTAALCETLVLRRCDHGPPFPGNYSGMVAVTLLALAMPPLAPWWLVCLGSAFAILIVRQLYGGLGCNLFNPAMTAYIFLLLCFPLHFTHWPISDGARELGLIGTLATIFGSGPKADGLSGATVLAYMQAQLAQMSMLREIRSAPLFGQFGGRHLEWVNMAFLCGGLYLVFVRTIHWRIPIAVLTGVLLCSGLFWMIDNERHASPLFHLASGGTILCAFFIATEPVSGVSTPNAGYAYGLGIGVLICLIRILGSFPDGVAFAVVCMNCLAPLIDHCCKPQRAQPPDV